MKKLLIIAFVGYLFNFVAAQTAVPSKPFTVNINGTIKKFEGKWIYLHHEFNQQMITDSAKVNKGKFLFSLKSTEPNLFWITPTRDVNSESNFAFFADETPMRAALNGDSLFSSSIEGGTTQRDYKEYTALSDNIMRKQAKMQIEYNTALEKNDTDKQDALKEEYNTISRKYVADLKDFIKKHPKSVVSAYLVFVNFSGPDAPMAELEETIAFIDKSLENTTFYKLAAEKIITAKGTTVGNPATNFSQENTEGKLINLSDFKGKYVLIDFWASWCRPCRQENPNVVAAYNKFKDKGFTVLGVSLDQNKQQWVKAIETDKLSWMHVSDLKGWGNSVAQLYGVTGIPQNYLLDKEGKIIAKDLRGEDLMNALNALFK